MPRLTGDGHDRGATAVLIALVLSGVLIGFSALVVDVGGLFAERRQLQNGADAGSLAAAATCASSTGCTSAAALTIAQQFANSNSNDNTSNVDLVCGTGLGTCPSNQGPWDCLALPAGALGTANFVQVQTSTRRTGGSTVIGPVLARAMTGNAGYTGTTVRACARASYGPLASIPKNLPVTFSKQEWACWTNNGTSFVAEGSYPPWPQEKQINLHQGTSASPGPCPPVPSPAGTDLPGGFGWLTSDPNTCETVESAGGTKVDVDPGASISQACKSLLSGLLGTIVDIPIFDDTNGLNGQNGSYHLAGFASFYLAGYKFPGAVALDQITQSATTCAGGGSVKCIKGFFVKRTSPSDGVVGSGSNYGTTVIQMSG